MDLNQLTKHLIHSEHPFPPTTLGPPPGRSIWFPQRWPPTWGPSPGPDMPGLDHTKDFKDLVQIIGNEGRTRVVISAAFWQVLSSSEVFRHLLSQVGIDDPTRAGGRLILTMHCEDERLDDRPRYDLLVLSPQLSMDQMRSVSLAEVFFSLHVTWGDFEKDFFLWNEHRYRELYALQEEGSLTEGTFEAQSRLLDRIAHRSGPYFVEDLASVQRFSVLFAPMPETIFTGAAISPAWGIAMSKDVDPISTVGAVVTDREGTSGVTACLHGVVPDPNSITDMFNEHGSACVVGKKVYVNGYEGVIRRADLITDSCFIETDPGLVLSDTSNRGPLKDKGPSRQEPVMFEGLASKRQDTFVTEIDISIPFVGRGEQAKVYTHPITNPGDSGAALINKDGYVLGFSHRRTGLTAPLEFSEWIWAHSVYNALRL